jgi:hypothetical protein
MTCEAKRIRYPAELPLLRILLLNLLHLQIHPISARTLP